MSPETSLGPRELAVSDLAEKVLRKSTESARTKERFFAAEAPNIVRCCQTMVRAFDSGARLYVFGNGGSSCDAQHISVEFMHPILEKRPSLPAMSLVCDTAVLTAIGNDQDFALAYAQQLKMLGRPGDIALGISTSGKSASVNRAMQTARELGMITVAFSGRDGGKLPLLCDFCFTVPSFSIHRIQETQETLFHVIWDLIHVIRGEEDVI